MYLSGDIALLDVNIASWKAWYCWESWAGKSSQLFASAPYFYWLKRTDLSLPLSVNKANTHPYPIRPNHQIFN